jgi:excisionase family DNA binding protein
MSLRIVTPAGLLPPFLTYDDVAARWQCSPATVARLAKRGVLARVRIGTLVRISTASVLAYEEQGNGTEEFES